MLKTTSDSKLKTAGIAGGWLAIVTLLWQLLKTVIEYFSASPPSPAG